MIQSNDLRRAYAAIADEIKQAIDSVLESQIFTLGPQLDEFESLFAEYTGTEFCVGMASGTDALVAALIATGVRPGDNVIVPAFTFIATPHAVSMIGAKPIFADIDPATMTIDPIAVAKAAHNLDNVTAIVPVHLFGQPCDMDAIFSVAEEHNLAVVEDNAQAHGALHNGKRTGALGMAAATSFYPTKNLGAIGEAGAVTTDSELVAKRLEAIRNFGSTEPLKYDFISGNAKMDEIQAAVLKVKLKYLDTCNKLRKHIANHYTNMLEPIVPTKLLLQRSIDGTERVWHQYVIRTELRDPMKSYLLDNEILTSIHYPLPCHMQRAYSEDYLVGSCPVAEEAARTCLSLPLYPGLTVSEMSKISNTVRQFFEDTKVHDATNH